MQLLPLLLLLLFTFLSGSDTPVYQLRQTRTYAQPQETGILKVPYFVQDAADFAKQYPEGSNGRRRLEIKVEREHKHDLEQRCYSEKLYQKKMYHWDPKRAQGLNLQACKDLHHYYSKNRNAF